MTGHGFLSPAERAQIEVELPDDPQWAEALREDTAKLVRMAADRDLTNDDPEQLRTTGARMMRSGAQLVSISARRRA